MSSINAPSNTAADSHRAIDLDQIEQQVINGRRSLLNTCTSLDNSIDDLKIRIGLPTEQLINLDLSELDMLTSRDELAVNADLICASAIDSRRKWKPRLLHEPLC